MVRAGSFPKWNRWHIVLGLTMVAATVGVTFPAWKDLYTIAMKDEEASHVLLVPIAVAWLAWVRRGRLRQCRPARSILGVVILAAGWLTWSLGYRWNYQSLWHSGAVMMAVGALIAMLGKDLMFRFFPAFVVLVFLVPMPGRLRQKLAVPLQTTTAHVTEGVLDVMGVPVERQGNLLSINGQAVTIAEACNGMRMVFTLVLVSYIFAFTTPLRGYVRIIILLFSPITAIICNVIRLVPTVWVYGHASAETASAFHDASGWVMLVVAFLSLMGVVRALQWAMIPVSELNLAAG